MSKREAIASYIIEQLQAIRSVKTVTREPKALEELSKTSFPHVLIESANEVRDVSSYGDGVRVQADIDFLINIVVMGADRDKQRNALLDAVERKLQADPTLGGNCYDSQVTQIQIREIEESSPYGTVAMIYTVRYFYTRGTP